jgi:hypothetical protein
MTTSSAHAVACTDTIKEIQIEGTKALVLLGNGSWHVLAVYGTAAFDQKVSFAMAAKLSGKRLYLNYPTGTCTAIDYSTEPDKVRLVD